MENLMINLTQHNLTADQTSAATWVEMTQEQVAEIRNLLTFEDIPSSNEMVRRAAHIANIVADNTNATHAMIGGAPFFMSTLEEALKTRAIKPVYAFSERTVVEETTEAGETRKTAVFRHKGWVYA